MANSIVFIVMVTHQCAYTPRIHLQGKALYKLRVITSYCALFKPADNIFYQFFIFAG